LLAQFKNPESEIKLSTVEELSAAIGEKSPTKTDINKKLIAQQLRDLVSTEIEQRRKQGSNIPRAGQLAFSQETQKLIDFRTAINTVLSSFPE